MSLGAVLKSANYSRAKVGHLSPTLALLHHIVLSLTPLSASRSLCGIHPKGTLKT